MKNNVYNLMNWPQIEGITYADDTQPAKLLGGHMCKDGFLIQIYRPDAVDVSVTVEQKKYVCENVDDAGYFAVLIPSKKPLEYSVTAEKLSGEVSTYKDPYSFDAALKPADKKKFLAGNSFNAYEFMGAHVTEIGGTEGMLFAVWAPNARRVSVIGEFNGYDGRICQMNADEDGIFTLFLPEVTDISDYCYEIKLHDGQTVRKADPYYLGDNDLNCEYIWDDTAWKADFSQDRPLAVCGIDVDTLLSDKCVENIKRLGFNCVEISGAVSGDDSAGIALGNMCVDSRIGADRLRSIIDEFHKNSIAVIMDCNLAYMRQGVGCLVYYDGTHLYDVSDTRLGKNKDFCASSYDYKKNEVRSYLYSTVDYWIRQFHADGIRLEDVAAMLYLDYGKNSGEWTPNMYGGKENLEAVELIQNIRKYIDKLDRKVLLIAQENSIWDNVTGDIKKDGLGFDYQWNNGWKEDFLDFYRTDPLFRKGKYDRLTHSMLYQYSENYMLEFSDGSFDTDGLSEFPLSPELDDEKKAELSKSHRRSALGYMYAYPGKKLVNYKDCDGIEDYVARLNKAYFSDKTLYELDNSPKGFEWVNTDRADETVLSFVRMSSDGAKTLCVANFTPVDRSEFRMGVPYSGKYTSVSDGKVYKTVSESCDGREEAVTLPVLGLKVNFFKYEEYTETEKKENAIISEAKAAFEEAQRAAQRAKEVEEEAKARAKAAKEAEEQARKAAEEADAASKEAHRQAAEAKKRCEQVELDARKKLEALKNGK